MGDVLRNDPGVRVAKGFGNFHELYVIRGFPVFSDDMTYDGIYGIHPRQFVAAELVERGDVARAPTYCRIRLQTTEPFAHESARNTRYPMHGFLRTMPA